MKTTQDIVKAVANQNTNDDVWLTLHEGAAHIKISPRTLREKARIGEVKSYRMIGTNTPYRFRKSDLDSAYVINGE